MGWTGLPLTPTSFQDLNDWTFNSQFIYALRERNSVGLRATNVIWPPPNNVWSSGTVSSVTDNGDGTLTFGMDAGGEWTVDSDSGCTGQRWIGYTCPTCLCYLPSNYDLVIEGDNTDPYTVVRGTITAQTYTAPSGGTTSTACGDLPNPPAPKGTGTLTVSDVNFKNAITSKFIANLSYLVGKQYYILKQGGLWCSDRFLTKPNQPEEWKGTVDVGMIDSSGNGYLQNDTNLFNPNPYNDPNPPPVQWSNNWWVQSSGMSSSSSSSSGGGWECMVYTADGYLHRLPITANNSNTLYFGSSSSSSSSGGLSSSSSSSPLSLTGDYSIIRAGLKCDPNREAGYPFVSYSGIGTGFISHNVDDSLGTTTLPATTTGVYDGLSPECGGDGCATDSKNALDIDVNTGVDNQCLCSGADTFLAPQFYASIRAMQNSTLGLGPTYIDNTWSGNTNTVPYLYPARLFNVAGINAWTGSGSYVSDTTMTVPVSITPPFYPYPVYYYIEGTDYTGAVTIKYGVGQITDSYTLTDSGFNAFLTTPINPCTSISGSTRPDSPINVWLSYGFTRYIPLEFRYLYPKTAFIPDCTDGCIDPPSVTNYADTGCTGVGMYVYRGVSQTYAEYTNAFIGDTSLQFQAGDLARMIGDSFNDPFAGIADVTSIQPSTPYWDHFYRGKNKKANYEARLAKLGGSATSTTNYSLTDNTKHFWTDQNGSGVLRIDSGTATDGSTTTLVDSTKTSGESNCWWQMSRFNGAEFSWQGFYLEIFKGGMSSSSSSSGSGPTYFKVPITGCDPTAGTIEFAAVTGLNVAAGDSYQIQEPANYTPNDFQGRWLKTTFMIGSSSSAGQVLLTGNDDTTLFFPPQDGPVMDGAAYQIIEYPYGTTWQYATTAPTDGRNYVPVNITTSGSSSSSSGTTAYWVQPVGTDTRSMSGISSSSSGWTFMKDQTANEPKIVKRYGIFEKGDIIALETYNELYYAINKLTRTSTSVIWTSRVDQCTAENNCCPGITYGGVTEPTFSGYVFCSPPSDYPYCGDRTVFDNWEDALAAAQNDILAYLASPVPFNSWPIADCPPSNACGDCDCGMTPSENNGVAPYKTATATAVQRQSPSILNGDVYGDLGEGGGADVQSVYAYAQVFNVATTFGVSVDYYNFATTYSGNPPTGWCWSSTTVSGCDPYDYISSGTSIQFGNSGDAVQYNLWTQWDSSESVNDLGYGQSKKLGSQTTGILPTLLADPSAPMYCYEWTAFAESGYNVTNAIAVLNWSFTYV